MTSPTETRALAKTQGSGPHSSGESEMSRYKDLALRLAVVTSFVLVLAAPWRW
jgi:hypothetical protein